jgi:hypothetical protein
MKNMATSFLMIISIISVSLFISKQTTAQRYRHNAVVVSRPPLPHPYPVWGMTVSSRPAHAMLINNGRSRYYYHNGFYYTPYAGGYQVVRPASGVRIRVLPFGFQTIMIGRRPYYFFNGVYYKPCSQGFVVVDAPRY